jgi:FkbM family methyltransferase
MTLPLTARLARRLRHAPGLRHATGLWNQLRPAYNWLLDPFGRGVALRLGDRAIRLPAPLLTTHPDWSSYERSTLIELTAWLEAHAQSPLLLDLGCSFGVISSFALQTSPTLRVIAFDSDATSLRAMEAVVPRSAHPRLRRIRGLLGVEHGSGQTVEQAEAATLAALPPIPARDAITRSTYICFDEASAEHVPRHRLDSLLESMQITDPVLIKCDVEGAELLVLSGAKETLARLRPVLLLSVHPKHLPRHGHSPADLAAFLDAAGYDWRCFDRDHEEHWLATPRT